MKGLTGRADSTNVNVFIADFLQPWGVRRVASNGSINGGSLATQIVFDVLYAIGQ